MIENNLDFLLTRLQDNVLLQIRGEGLADESGQGLDQDEKVVYVVHPNCAVEEM